MRKFFLRKSLFAFVALIFLVPSCRKADTIDYRNEMRHFVERISQSARNRQPGFIIVPQNGHNLLTADGTANGALVVNYRNAIDGMGREDLFYGYEEDDQLTPAVDHEEMLGMMRRATSEGVRVLATDYCSTPSKMDDSYSKNAAENFLSFAADHRELDNIPAYPAQPVQADTASIYTLAQAHNFLYLINPEQFTTKENFLQQLAATNYDAFIIDLFFDKEQLTAADINRLRYKPNGARRLVLCYMSIGEAEDYRWYWQPWWRSHPPSFLQAEDASWPGNYTVRYWDPSWQEIICGDGDSYLHRMQDSGFDGAYLDLIDAYEYYEN